MAASAVFVCPRPSYHVCRLNTYMRKSCQPAHRQVSNCSIEETIHIPPPTRHITRFVLPLAPGRASVVSLHVTSLVVSGPANEYCARISSPSFGVARKGGSTRLMMRLCAREFTTFASSISRGSRGFVETYSYIGTPSPPGVAAPERLGGREGVRGLADSRKLDGGIDRRGVTRNALRMSGVRAPSAEARNDMDESGRKESMLVPGRDAESTWTLGMGIIERLGGRAGRTLPPGVCERGPGENICCMNESSPSLEVSEGDLDIDRQCDFEGAGMWLGVFGRERGSMAGPGVCACDRDGGR